MRRTVDLASLRSIPALNLLVLVITGLVGIFGQSILERLAPPLFQPANTPYIVFVLTCAMYLVSITIWRYTLQQVASTTDHIGVLAKAVGHRVQVVSDVEGYRQLEKRIRNAKSEILILTNYAFDWENGKPVYDPDRMQIHERRGTYSAIHRKLQREKRSGFRFVRIVQIPEGHRLEEVLPFDDIYREECELLAALTATEPEFASLRVSEPVFQNTFCLIDRSFVYLEFDVSRSDPGQLFTPFVMMIEDPNSEAIQELLKLHQRIEANARLITSLNS